MSSQKAERIDGQIDPENGRIIDLKFESMFGRPKPKEEWRAPTLTHEELKKGPVAAKPPKDTRPMPDSGILLHEVLWIVENFFPGLLASYPDDDVPGIAERLIIYIVGLRNAEMMKYTPIFTAMEEWKKTVGIPDWKGSSDDDIMRKIRHQHFLVPLDFDIELDGTFEGTKSELGGGIRAYILEDVTVYI